MEELNGLKYLIHAPSKAGVDQIFSKMLRFVKEGTDVSDKILNQLSNGMELELSQAAELSKSICWLIKLCVRPKVNLSMIPGAFSEEIDPRLKKLCLQIIEGRLEDWKEFLLEKKDEEPKPQLEDEKVNEFDEKEKEKEKDQTKSRSRALPKITSNIDSNQCLGPNLPMLQSFDWRIDVESSSDSISAMSVPTVLVEFKIQNEKKIKNKEEELKSKVVSFECSKEALSTMLDGLHIVRNQLDRIK